MFGARVDAKEVHYRDLININAAIKAVLLQSNGNIFFSGMHIYSNTVPIFFSTLLIFPIRSRQDICLNST
jgi:hypothetical protein